MVALTQNDFRTPRRQRVPVNILKRPPKSTTKIEANYAARLVLAVGLVQQQVNQHVMPNVLTWVDQIKKRDPHEDSKVKRPGSRGGHIIGWTAKGEPIYGKPPKRVSHVERPKAHKPPELFSNKANLPDWVRLDKSTGPTRENAERRMTNVEKKKKALREFVSSSSAMIRLPIKSLIAVMGDGRFKNQFESGTSGGDYDIEERKAEEMKMFGIPHSPPPPNSHRPIYGYFHPDGNTVDEGSDIEWYGEIRCRFKEHVKNRSTLTIGDSLYGNTRPSTFHDPGLESYRSGIDATLESSMLDTEIKVDDDNRIGYVEAQYHGGLLVDDIAEVTFSYDPNKLSLPEGPVHPERALNISLNKKITDILDKKNIPWKVSIKK